MRDIVEKYKYCRKIVTAISGKKFIVADERKI